MPSDTQTRTTSRNPTSRTGTTAATTTTTLHAVVHGFPYGDPDVGARVVHAREEFDAVFRQAVVLGSQSGPCGFYEEVSVPTTSVGPFRRAVRAYYAALGIPGLRVSVRARPPRRIGALLDRNCEIAPQ